MAEIFQKTFSCKNDIDSAKQSIKTSRSSDGCIKELENKISDSSVLNKHHIPNCFPGVNDKLSRPYQLTYHRGKLPVRCYLRNGHTKDKYFPCSTMGNND